MGATQLLLLFFIRKNTAKTLNKRQVTYTEKERERERQTLNPFMFFNKGKMK